MPGSGGAMSKNRPMVNTLDGTILIAALIIAMAILVHAMITKG